MIDTPLRTIAPSEIVSLNRDGAVLLKNVLPQLWLDILEEGLEQANRQPGGMSSNVDGPLRIDQFPSNQSPALARFIAESPVAELVGRALDSPVRFYMDQMFYKPAGEIEPTPWHQDTCYYNIEGQDLVRAWVSPDFVPRDISMEVVRGSHRWNVTYHTWVGRPLEEDPEGAARAMKAIAAGEPVIGVEAHDTWSYANAFRDNSMPAAPDIEAYKASFDILGWDYEPGDVLLFHGHILHGAEGGRHSTQPRRAHASMWAGNDIRYIHRLGQVVPDPKGLYRYKPRSGDSLASFPDVFPVVWQPR
ncbi:MAG: phytanoyl-CoA dioxygenase family protein [Halieaceae bacterium]|nr:phytanoyl-CoA dioxygenase family protein [Halieaceae bacterium]MDG2411305.1 phytanoyl-CoA dioxygenase family protein [Halioglobus sp.]